MKKITINDIAKLAGVTKGTVSMVLNDYKSIPKKTKDRILGIMKDNDYYPFESAHMLAKGKSDTIAFMTTRFAAPFLAELLDAFERKAIKENKYVHNIVPYSTRNDPKVRDELFKKILYGRKASAVVAVALNPDPKIIREYKRNGIPVILIENDMKGANSVNVDNFKGGFAAAEYLIKSGRKRIGLITGGLDIKTPWGLNPSAIERKAGFESALEKYGRVLKKQHIEMTHNYNREEGKISLDNFISRKAGLDAIFCSAGDAMAMGVLERAREIGIKIPDDLAVIGFDDMVYAAQLNPPLTTVRQPIEDIASAAFDMAVDAMEGKLKKEKHVIFDPVLIIRKSA